jgi:hypothetical protein
MMKKAPRLLGLLIYIRLQTRKTTTSQKNCLFQKNGFQKIVSRLSVTASLTLELKPRLLRRRSGNTVNRKL